MRERNFARISKYAKTSRDQDAIDKFLKENGATQLTSFDNSGKIYQFNGHVEKAKRDKNEYRFINSAFAKQASYEE